MNDGSRAIQLFCGASGTKPGAAVDRIVKALPEGSAEYVDLESELEALVASFLSDPRSLAGRPPFDEALAEYLLSIRPRWTLQDITANLPPDVVIEMWRTTAENAIAYLLKHPAQHKFLKTHLIYYRSETFEFYSPAPKYLRDILEKESASVGHLTIFIDDVYDMYVRLTQEGEVFAFSDQLRDEHLRVREAEEQWLENGSMPEEWKSALLFPEERYRIALSLVVSNLLRLLRWRDMEIQAGQQLAHELKTSSQVIATKHPTMVATAAVTEPDATLTYLSHPISRPRRDQKKNGVWPDFVGEYHDFLHAILRSKQTPRMIPIMPTAIDEYRLRSEKLVFRDVHYQPFLKEVFVPALAPRWPLLCDPAELLWEIPGGDLTTYAERTANIFNPPTNPAEPEERFIQNQDNFWQKLPSETLLELSGILRTLVLTIRYQMAMRDHLLVQQCPGFLLYRPFYDEGGFSRGVSKELQNWEGRVRTMAGPGAVVRPISFLHATADLTQTDKELPTLQALKDQVVSIVRRRTGYSLPMQVLQGLNWQNDSWFDELLRAREISIGTAQMTAQDRKRLNDDRHGILAAFREVVKDLRTSAATNGANKIPGAIWVFHEFEADGPMFGTATPDEQRAALWDTFAGTWKTKLTEKWTEKQPETAATLATDNPKLA